MLMPNPNKGQFTIDGLMKSAGTENVTVVITNLVGQVIYLQDVRVTNGRMHHMVSLGASVPNGNYEVSITSSEDHVVYHVVVDR